MLVGKTRRIFRLINNLFCVLLCNVNINAKQEKAGGFNKHEEFAVVFVYNECKN